MWEKPKHWRMHGVRKLHLEEIWGKWRSHCCCCCTVTKTQQEWTSSKTHLPVYHYSSRAHAQWGMLIFTGAKVTGWCCCCKRECIYLQLCRWCSSLQCVLCMWTEEQTEAHVPALVYSTSAFQDFPPFFLLNAHASVFICLSLLCSFVSHQPVSCIHAYWNWFYMSLFCTVLLSGDEESGMQLKVEAHKHTSLLLTYFWHCPTSSL